VHVDAVKVGVFLKSDRKFAEIRPMARALSVNLEMSRALEGPLVARRYRYAVDRFASEVRVTNPDQVDNVLCGWLTEAYDEATD
jgi:hypothetical protein